MTSARSEQDMVGYKEVTFPEGVPHRLYLLIIASAFGATVFAVTSALRETYIYLYLLLPLFVVLLGISAAIHKLRNCNVCNSRLNIYSNSDQTTDVARYYFHVCEKCKTYARYSFWADLG